MHIWFPTRMTYWCSVSLARKIILSAGILLLISAGVFYWYYEQRIYRLDSLIGQKLAPLLYVAGLAGIVLWAVSHLVASFEVGFAQGLWGILEILVYGALALVVLRVACEMVLVFFASREASAVGIDRASRPGSLLDEVGDAIRELAEDDDIMPATDPAPFQAGAPEDQDFESLARDLRAGISAALGDRGVRADLSPAARGRGGQRG